MNEKPSRIGATIAYLRRCQAARAVGYPVSYTTDPAWLLDVAINRRAGWPDDPSHSRGSAMPVNGKYPRKAEGQRFMHLWRIARDVNTPRLRVYVSWLGEWRALLMARIPGRFAEYGDE